MNRKTIRRLGWNLRAYVCMVLLFTQPFFHGCGSIAPGGSGATRNTGGSSTRVITDAGIGIPVEAGQVVSRAGTGVVAQLPEAEATVRWSTASEDVVFQSESNGKSAVASQLGTRRATVVIKISPTENDPLQPEFAIANFLAEESENGSVSITDGDRILTSSAVARLQSGSFSYAFDVLTNFSGAVDILGFDLNVVARPVVDVTGIEFNPDTQGLAVMRFTDPEEGYRATLFGTPRDTDGNFDTIGIAFSNISNGRWFALVGYSDSEFQYLYTDDNQLALLTETDYTTDWEDELDRIAANLNGQDPSSFVPISAFTASTADESYVIASQILVEISASAQGTLDRIDALGLSVEKNRQAIVSVAPLIVALTFVALGAAFVLYAVPKIFKEKCRRTEDGTVQGVCSLFGMGGGAPKVQDQLQERGCPFVESDNIVQSIPVEACLAYCTSTDCTRACAPFENKTPCLEFCEQALSETLASISGLPTAGDLLGLLGSVCTCN